MSPYLLHAKTKQTYIVYNNIYNKFLLQNIRTKNIQVYIFIIPEFIYTVKEEIDLAINLNW